MFLVIALVGNDAAWQQIVRDQVRFLGKSTAGLLTYQDYHLVAKGFGAEVTNTAISFCFHTHTDTVL